MLPSVFTENLFDEMFDDMFNNMMPMVAGRRNPLYGKHSKNLMKTDVRETESAYEMDVDLPGFKKDEVQVQLENGYLTISASKGLDREERGKEGPLHPAGALYGPVQPQLLRRRQRAAPRT